MVYKKLPSGVDITFVCKSATWDDECFLKSGGMVAVVLNYNKKTTIRDACESALQQDYPCYEVLLMDDCSTDGSDAIMMEVAEAFRRKCEGGNEPRAIQIMVVRNKLNQTILGQWSVAVSVSRGNWFGMFCGDDVSHPDRLAVAKRYIDKYADLLGFCTSGRTSKGEHMGGGTELLTWSGDELTRPCDFWLGCTSFWKREVLEKSFGRHNLDDYVLWWAAIVLGQGYPSVRLIWALNETTVEYSVGTGVSTELFNAVGRAHTWLGRQWQVYRSMCQRRSRFGIHTWRLIDEFDQKYGSEGFVRDQIRGYMRWAWLQSGNWWRRLITIFRIVVLERHDAYGGARKDVVDRSLKLFYLFIFGGVSFIALMIPGAIKRSMKKAGV